MLLFAGAIIEALVAVLFAAGALVGTLVTLVNVIKGSQTKQLKQITK